jgi:transcription elongation factor GreA
MESKDEIEYVIVGSTEIDPFGNKISTESPVGRSLIGKKVGETASVDTPSGRMKLKIINIHRV